MIENVTDLPPGTLGFSASGKITSDEYRRMIEPIYAALERDRIEAPLVLAADGARHGQGLGQARRERVRLAGPRRTAPLRAIRARGSSCLVGRDLVQLTAGVGAPEALRIILRRQAVRRIGTWYRRYQVPDSRPSGGDDMTGAPEAAQPGLANG